MPDRIPGLINHLTPNNIIQIVNVTTGAVATGTALIPYDDTIPQNTEGTEVLTLAITPTNANNKLLIQVVIFLSPSIERWITAALFQDSTVGALAASMMYVTIAGGGLPLVFNHFMVAGTILSTTFKVRMGPYAAATITMNGTAGARYMGGVMASGITITEIKA